MTKGVSLQAETSLISFIGIGSIFGRFVLTGLGDRLGRLRLLVMLTFLFAGSFVIWSAAAGFITFVLFAVLFGVSYGGCVGLYPAVAAELFGSRHIGATLGYLYTAVGVAALFGPPLSGFVFDQTGSYLGSTMLSLATAAAAAVLTHRLKTKSPESKAVSAS